MSNFIDRSRTEVGKRKPMHETGCANCPACSVLHTKDGIHAFFIFS